MQKLFNLPTILAIVLLMGGMSVALAEGVVDAQPGAELHVDPARKGWFWYRDPKKDEPKEEELVPPVPEVKPAPKILGPIVVITRSKEDEEKKCLEKDTWEAKCGFVDPGDDFDFQAKQRDILLQQMSMRPDVPEAVEAAQRYMKWVVGRASMAANMWYFNMVQSPDLDPRIKNPISEVGIALATRVQQASQFEYFKLIKEEGGILFFFTRSDCSFCHDQAVYTRRVAHTMGLRVINIPLDGKCLAGFDGDDCGDNIKPEQVAVLDVRIVPAIYLFVPSNTWIRLGTGIVTDETILANTVNFFSAYRAAMLNGLDNSKGARPSVTFDPAINAKPAGATSADGSAPASLPDKSRMLELLGYKKPNTP